MWHDLSMSITGKLLVATPSLSDPNFHRTVILLLQHDDEGALGVVLNRPSTEALEDHLPDWAPKSDPPIVFFGGPVAPEVAIGMVVGEEGSESTEVSGLMLIDLERGAEDIVSPVRVYSGYAGWGAGQLELEIGEGAWYVVDAEAADPLLDPDSMWSVILHRQEGPLRLVATYPDDPSLN